MSWIHVVAAVLLLGGTAFSIIAAIGLIRLPDLYTRMHAVTKAGTLGIGLILVGAAVFFGELSVTTRAIAVIAFVLLTAPVSGHMIGRAGYFSNVKLWDRSVMDQWQADFDDVLAERSEDDELRSDANLQARSSPSEVS